MTDEQRDAVLSSLHNDLEKKKYLLETIKDEILSQDISNYPIFVASTNYIDLGKLLIDKVQGGNWHFSASHLEEFVHKSIIAMDKVDGFRDLYKQHADELCIFVIDNDMGDFVFLP
ncbi:MAG: hypothetical protein R2836_07730 [Chitinophagales bacterium]|nr:hypothetical protein [Bacteroidota bacterium]MCB9226043.1 hypothetical protein [Chitinophagales bacterium]